MWVPEPIKVTGGWAESVKRRLAEGAVEFKRASLSAAGVNGNSRPTSGMRAPDHFPAGPAADAPPEPRGYFPNATHR